MRNENRLTFGMQVFLRGIRDRLVVLPVLVAREEIKPQLLARWLRHPVFLETMGDMVRELRTRVRLELDMLAACAVRELGEMMQRKQPEEKMIMLCRTILDAHDKTRRFYRGTREGKRRGARTAKRAAENNLCHPNSRAVEDELLAMLNGPEEAAEGVTAAAAAAATPSNGDQVK